MVESYLGFGSYGRVLQAKRNGRIYAIKMLRNRGEPSDIYFLRYQLETEILKRVNHPRIPAFVESFSIGDVHCIVQELISGYPLSHMIANGYTFKEEEIKKIILQLLGILKELHCPSQGGKAIVHRDLRLSNLMLNNGKLYLIDFGFARFLEPFQFPYCPDPPKYSSPYQLLRRKISPRSDLFGTGVVALDLFTNWIKDEALFNQPWDTVLPITPWFAGFIKKLLSTDDDNAYHSVEEGLSEYVNQKF